MARKVAVDAKWHVDKKVPLALIVTIIVQTGTIVWWARGVSSDLEVHRRAITKLENAQSDNNAIATRISVVETELKSLNATAGRLERVLERFAMPVPARR